MSASPRYLRSGLADRHLGLLLLVAATLGGLTGGLTAGYLDGRVLALLFGLLLVAVAIQMLRQIRRPTPHPPIDDADYESGFLSTYVEPRSGELVAYRARRLIPGTTISFLAGNVSGLLGVGGGVINVPTMNMIMHVPLRVATTTSTYMLAATAATSAVVYLAAGQLDPLLAAPVALGVIVGARVGARLAMRVLAGRAAYRLRRRGRRLRHRDVRAGPWRHEPAARPSGPRGPAAPDERRPHWRRRRQRGLLPGGRPGRGPRGRDRGG